MSYSGQINIKDPNVPDTFVRNEKLREERMQSKIKFPNFTTYGKKNPGGYYTYESQRSLPPL